MTRARFAVLLIILAACTAPPTPTATPTIPPATVTLLTINYPVELSYLLPDFNACGNQVANLSLLYFENLVPPLPQDGQSVTIWLGEPPAEAAFAARLGETEIVVAVNANNPAQDLTADEIRQIFTGKMAWEVPLVSISH